MLHYHLYAYDSDFDLLEGHIPTDIRFDFGDQIRRARQILSGRTRAELDYALSSLDWMLDKGSERLLPEALASIRKSGHSDSETLSRTKALKMLVDDIDISDQSHFPNATWADYFAALALAFVGEFLCDNNFRPALNGSSSVVPTLNAHVERPHGLFRTDHALEAMEAVCYAEQLRHEAALRAEWARDAAPDSQIMAERGRLGGKMRASKFDELKTQVLSLYESQHSSRSNRNAAMLVAQELGDEIREVLTADDPVKTLEKWIGAYKKSLVKRP